MVRRALLRGFDAKLQYGAGSLQTCPEEVSSGGDKLHLSEVTGSITVHDYVKGTDLAAPEQPSDADNVLNLDQHKAFNIAVEDIERFQARPAVFEEWTRQGWPSGFTDIRQAYVYSVYDTTWDGHHGRRQPLPVRRLRPTL